MIEIPKFKEILSALIVAYVSWLSYTVLELTKQNTLIEYKIDRVHEVLQSFSEELSYVSGSRIILMRHVVTDNDTNTSF